MRIIFIALAAFGLVAFSARAARACPGCPIGRLARRQVCEQGLGENLAIAVAPFLVVLGVCVLVERIGKRAGRRLM